MKKYVLIGGLVLALTLTATSVFSNLDSFNLGQSIQKTSKSEKVVAKVSEIPITEKEFNSKKLFLEEQSKSKIPNQIVLREIAKQKLLVKTAKDEGLTVTTEELERFIESQKQMSLQAEQDSKSDFNDFLAGQGLTAEQYWADPLIRKGYENGMYIGKLRQKIKTELPNNTDAESTEKYITEKINKIVDSKKIDVSDPNYK